MSKGHQGQSCADAIRDSLRPGEVATFTTLFQRVKRQGDWRDGTIWQHLMSCVVNIPPARHQWPGRDPFLYLHPDGRYELYDKAVHPEVKV